MKFFILLTIFSFSSTLSLGQKDYMQYVSKFETADTSFNIKLKARERHRKRNLKCYQNLEKRVNNSYVSKEFSDSIQDFFISKVENLLEPKIVERLHFGEVEFFNERVHPNKDSLVESGFYDFRCDSVLYGFRCFFMFDDSLWFPLQLYLNRDEELMNRPSIIESLGKLSTYELPSRSEIFRTVYNHRKFKKYPLKTSFELYYSENQKRFYYEFMAAGGKEIERTSHSATTKVNHVFVDAFTGKIIWKPTLTHVDGWGSCTIWKRIEMPKNKLIEN